MLKVVDLRGWGDPPRPAALALDPAVADAVRGIVARVRAEGDPALVELTRTHDEADIEGRIRVSEVQIDAASDTLAPDLRNALAAMAERLRDLHSRQLPAEWETERDGVRFGEVVRPLAAVGCYVPGGLAAYPSTVLMTAIPAQVAGVPEIALCVPPGPDGSVPQATLAAAALLGLEEVYRVGGAQAIAAMAYGTESIRPVDVIVGPGNVYVTLAKREVAGVVGIEATAGPSELVVVADESAPADYVAIDLMAQAEHGPGGAALLVTWSESLAADVAEAIDRLLGESSRRADTEATLRSGGVIVLVDGPEQAMDVANIVAPEHLELMNADPAALVPLVRHAGAVFCGQFAPAAVGDYVAGVNHVLPTARTARFSSALRVANFCKHLHVVGLDESALGRVAPYVAAFAETEGLESHAKSVRLRGARK